MGRPNAYTELAIYCHGAGGDTATGETAAAADVTAAAAAAAAAIAASDPLAAYAYERPPPARHSPISEGMGRGGSGPAVLWRTQKWRERFAVNEGRVIYDERCLSSPSSLPPPLNGQSACKLCAPLQQVESRDERAVKSVMTGVSPYVPDPVSESSSLESGRLAVYWRGY